MTRKTLADDCYRMATKGGYVLAFATCVAAEIADLTWEQFRLVLLANGHGFCGYAESVVQRAFERGRA